MSDSGESSQATPKRDQTAQVTSPTRQGGLTLLGSPRDAVTWWGRHQASLLPPVQQCCWSGLGRAASLGIFWGTEPVFTLNSFTCQTHTAEGNTNTEKGTPVVPLSRTFSFQTRVICLESLNLLMAGREMINRLIIIIIIIVIILFCVVLTIFRDYTIL